jgi:hypothetical protein
MAATAHLNGDAEHSHYLSVVKILLKNGANANHEDNNGNTSLMIAFDNYDLELFELILKHGHNVDTSKIPVTTNPNNELYDVLNKYNCRNCHSKTNHKKCGNCRIARYCSKECQKTDWRRTHKRECRGLCASVDRASVDRALLESFDGFDLDIFQKEEAEKEAKSRGGKIMGSKNMKTKLTKKRQRKTQKQRNQKRQKQ